MSILFFGGASALVGLLTIMVLREFAIRGPGLPGLEQAARATAAEERMTRRARFAAEPRGIGISVPTMKSAGAGLVGGALAAVVGLAAGALATLALVAWL